MERLFLTLLNRSIAAGWLILAVAAARALLGRAPKSARCALWALAGVRLALPVSLKSALSLIPSAETVPENAALSPAPAVQSGFDAVNRAVNPVLSRSLAAAPADSVNPAQVLLYLASRVWLAGLAAMLLYALVSYVRLRLRVRTAVRLRDNLWQSEFVASPFLFGVFRPRIYLPYGLRGADVDLVAAHENAHLRRGDHLWKPLGFLLLSVYWFQPLAWLAYVLFCRDVEAACDERVARGLDEAGRRAYSAALLACAAPRRSFSACPLAFGEGGVKRRIRDVLRYKKPALWAAAAALLVCAVLAVCFLTNPKPKSASIAVPETRTETSAPGTSVPETSALSADAASPAEALAVLARDKTPASLTLTRDGKPAGTWDAWGCTNDEWYGGGLADGVSFADTPVSAEPAGDSVLLAAKDGSWSVRFYESSDLVHYTAGGRTSQLAASYPAGETGTVWESARGWYDEAEFRGIGGAYDEQSALPRVPDVGQDYLAAAKAYCEAFEGLHKKASPGSKYCYTYVSCPKVEGAEETTASFRASGEIGQNTWAFLVTTVFVPENDAAAQWSTAGNTADYTGSDPSVPKGAMEYYRCGYITRESDGWRGELVGTGF